MKKRTLRDGAERADEFTLNELEYIYLQTDCDADREMFLSIEKKIRLRIPKYRDFDRAHSDAAKAARSTLRVSDDTPERVVQHEPGRCADCDDCARHAYSDSTSAGFFYDKCEKHRVSSSPDQKCEEEQKQNSV